MAITDGSVPRRTFIMEDPYDGRNEYKPDDNRGDLLHNDLSDDDTLSRDKLDMIFGENHSSSNCI